MVYKKNFALAIKAKGKILREVGEQVFIPFGSEYAIVLKNLHSVRASVRVWVDGKLITEGCSLIIKPNETVDLERFIRNANFSAGNRLKFIERTSSIEEHRGIKIDDGLVRIEYQFERIFQSSPIPLSNPIQHHTYWPVYPPGVRSPSFNPGQDNDIWCMSEPAFCNDTFGIERGVFKTSCSTEVLANNVGITVEGSISSQSFDQVLPLLLEDEVFAMTLQLVGQTDEGHKVEQPITVSVKPTCKTCGKVNKATSKFCSNCGTSLHLV